MSGLSVCRRLCGVTNESTSDSKQGRHWLIYIAHHTFIWLIRSNRPFFASSVVDYFLQDVGDVNRKYDGGSELAVGNNLIPSFFY